jgi:chaperonin GroES
MKIKPLHNHVVIKQQDETETMYGNIIVPDAGKEKALMGEVVAVGPGLINMNGVLIPNTVEVGQKVSFPAFGGQKLSIQGEDFLIYKEQDIFAVLEGNYLPYRLSPETIEELVGLKETVTIPKNEYNKLTNNKYE